MKVMNKIVFIFLFPLVLLADEFVGQFNYYGSVLGSQIDKDGFYVRKYQSDIIEDRFQFNSYSKLGGQFIYYNSDFMFMMQGNINYKDNEINGDLNWLNLRYNINRNFSTRVGKMQIPTFLNADSLSIDYTQLWAKAPNFVYSMMPLRSFNGVEFIYSDIIGDYYLMVEFVPYGYFKDDLGVSIVDISQFHYIMEFDNIKNIALSLSKSNFEFKVTYSDIDMDMPISSSLFNLLLSTLESYGNDIAEYTYEDRKGYLFTVGASYNYNNFTFTTEAAKTKTNSFYPDMFTYYGLVSYRVDDFTPFFMYAQNINNKDDYDASHIIDNSGGLVKNGLEQLLYTNNSSQTTISAGFRYDIDIGIALKFQVDYMTISDYGKTFDDIDRVGFLVKEAGYDIEPVIQTTFGINFAY